MTELPETRTTESRPRLGLALVGVGKWGQHWARTLSRSSAVDLLWACDPVARCELPSDTVWTRELGDCLNDPRVRAVVVATPLETHAHVGLAVLDAGRHLLLEKPATTRLAELEVLLERARTAQLVLMPNHLLLHHPAFAGMERALTGGAIGELRSITAIRISQGNRQNESAWWTLAPHDLALIDRLAPSLLEAPPLRERRGFEQRALFAHGDLRARLTLSLCGRDKVRLFALHGTRGTLLFDDLAEQQLTVHPFASAAELGEVSDPRVFLARLGRGCPLALDDGLPLERVLESFCARIGSGEGTTGIEANHMLRVVRALEQGEAHAATEWSGAVEVTL